MPRRSAAALADYRLKRDFSRTPEPWGNEHGEHRDAPAFALQKHAASRLHYDLRLELDGVLKCWAVPKGPSLDPEEPALAVQVEDHPLEYASFEGTIPQEEYGGGTMMLWDHGGWSAEGDPRRGYERGRLKLRFHGRRLRGRWLLVRMGGDNGEGDRNWLLRKLQDDHARPGDARGILEGEATSVVTGRSMNDIAKEQDPQRAPQPRGGEGVPPPPEDAPSSAVPVDLHPQLPTLVKKAPDGDEWFHELKFDGYRIFLRLEGGEARAITRKGHDWSDRFPGVVNAAPSLGADDTVMDGEVVVLLSDGTTDFQALQNVLGSREGSRGPVVFFAFDLPHYRGRDLTELPLAQRKELLRDLLAPLPPDSALRYSDHIQGDGPRVLDRACRYALEGIVSKRRDAPYRQGRHRSWVKTKCLQRQEFVVGGWTEPSGSRAHFGALLLGWYDDEGRLQYAGRVGTGFTDRSLAELHGRLAEISASGPPFADPPTGADARGVHWVEPRQVVEVEFGHWTDDGMVRHSSFQGLRDDKNPREVGREQPMEELRSEERRRPRRTDPPNVVAGVRLSNPDRVLYPRQGCTKADLARYYERVADLILPHVRHRPLSLVRCPRGHEEACFYQKHLTDSMSEPIRGIDVEEKDGPATYVGVDNVEGLVTLVQLGVLEIHPWGSRADRLDRPDRLVFDLDPGEGVGWSAIVDAAHRLRQRLEDLELISYVRTTGGKGLHVVAPLVRRAGWDEVKAFARDVARGFARRDPDRFVATASKAERRGRIFIDYLRNDRGATSIATYSTRARPGAPVATPLRWDELADLPRPDHYTIDNVRGRLKKLRRDPWKGFDDLRQSVTKTMRERAAG